MTVFLAVVGVCGCDVMIWFVVTTAEPEEVWACVTFELEDCEYTHSEGRACCAPIFFIFIVW